MFRSTFVLSLISAAFLLGGCATVPPDEDPVLLKLTELEDRLVRIERVVNNESLVGLQAQTDQLRQELREVRGIAETMQYETQEAAKRQRTQYLDLDGRLQTMEKRGGGGAFPRVGGSGSVGDGADRVAYEAAFDLLKTGRYEEAKKAFTDFTVAYPGSALVDNANYWLAEAQYVTGDYAGALTQFQNMALQYPTSAKVPDAMLKIGYCHYELGAFEASRASLETVVSTYPDTTQARLASQRLGQLTTEGH